MRWTADTDLASYAARVLPTLLRDPVRNNVACSLIQARRDGLSAIEPDGLWLHANDGTDEVVAAALRTPPHGLLLTPMSDIAVDALADHMAGIEPQLPNANGPIEVSRRFAARYAELTGRPVTAGLGSRLFDLREVRAPIGVPGKLREAANADRDLLVAWSDAFGREAVPGEPQDPARPIDMRLKTSGLLWLWERDGAAVSTAYLSPPVAGVMRVSGVYTPPELRGRGYASACVAAMSQVALDFGADACMLYTDLSNPTSNKIYQAIGYRPVDDAADWRFS